MNILIVSKNAEAVELLTKILQRGHGLGFIQHHADLWYSVGTFYDIVLIDINFELDGGITSLMVAQLIKKSGYKPTKIVAMGSSLDSIFDNIFELPQNTRQVKHMIERITINERFHDTASF